MPPGTYEATDPKTGQKWTWDGKKWNPVQKGSVQRYVEGLRGTMGMSPEGTFSGDISDLLSGAKHMAIHPIDSASLLLGGMAEGQQQVIDKAYEEQHDPNYWTKATGVVRGAESAIPFLGPILSSAGDKFSSGDVAGGIGAMTPVIAEPLMERGAPMVRGAAERMVKPVARDLLGVGKGDVAKQIEKTGLKESKVVESATKKVEAAKQKYADAVQDATQKRIEASAKETAAKTKQEALTSKHGPVYQRMNEMAEDAQQHVSKMEEKVAKAESEKWDKFNERIGKPTIDTSGTAAAIEHAQKNILTGESLPVFKQILGQIGQEDEGVAAILKNAAPEVREQAMAEGVLPQEGVPLDVARRLYTKVSRKMYGAELPTDVFRALSHVQDALDSDIAAGILKRGKDLTGVTTETDSMGVRWAKRGDYRVSIPKRITDSEIEAYAKPKLDEQAQIHGGMKGEETGKPFSSGADALREYRKLQVDWRKYRETFSDKNSPLRRITEAKDPNTKLGPITGETGARAIDYLGRYRDMGAQPEKLGRIRALHKSLKELPSTGGKAPGMPERPELPKTPEARTTSPEQARRDMLSSKESFYSRPPSRWELMFPPLLAYKMALKHLMQNPKFTEWLSKDSGTTTPIP
jgi:vacuolar-type H+-ATPase subunit H